MLGDRTPAHLNFGAEFDPIIVPKAFFQPPKGLVCFGNTLSNFAVSVGLSTDIASKETQFFGNRGRSAVVVTTCRLHSLPGAA